MGNSLDQANQGTTGGGGQPTTTHSCPAPQDWIEFQLLDAKGQPIASAPWEAKVPGESTARTGVLDGDGKAKIDKIKTGDCRIVFPKHEVGDWPNWIEIVLTDEKGAPVPSEKCKVEFSDGTTEEVTLGVDGKIKLIDKPVGPCWVTFPDLKKAWRMTGVSGRVELSVQGVERSQPAPTDHTVVAGDDIASIAKQYGFFRWQSIWNFQDNSALRSQRANPFTLVVGDVVKVPPMREQICGTNGKPATQPHVFRHWELTRLLRIRLTHNNQIMPPCDYELVVAGVTHTGTVSTEGMVTHAVDAAATSGTLKVWLDGDTTASPTREWTLELAQLPPITEKDGVLDRLVNMGLIADKTADNAHLLVAVNTLRKKENLSPLTSIDLDTMDSRTRTIIATAYGCGKYF
ncbi:MAG: hypothetical protein AB7E47_01245 [Desulfovibrionaceae bacterium]